MNEAKLSTSHARALQLLRERTAHQKNIRSLTARIQTIELELVNLDVEREKILSHAESE